MSIAFTAKSDELTAMEDPDYNPLKPTQLQGRVRIAGFLIQPTSLTIGQRIGLTKLPANARILDVIFQSDGALSGAQVLLIGYIKADGSEVSSGYFGSHIDTSGLGSTILTRDPQGFCDLVLDRETYIFLECSGANIGGLNRSYGYVLYVVD